MAGFHLCDAENEHRGFTDIIKMEVNKNGYYDSILRLDVLYCSLSKCYKNGFCVMKALQHSNKGSELVSKHQSSSELTDCSVSCDAFRLFSVISQVTNAQNDVLLF